MTIVNQIKTSMSPEHYYGSYLQGFFGKATGQCWHMWNGLCPFHHDKHIGSFVVNKATGAFRCFSCGACGGDIIDFHIQVRRVTFREAVNELREATLCTRS